MSRHYDSMLRIMAEECPDALPRIDRRLRAELRSTHVYIPAQGLDRAERNRRIREEFNGRNLREIMRHHGVSRATVYAVVSSGKP